MNLETVRHTATEVAQAHSFPVSVLGSVPATGGSQYVELLLRIEGCLDEPCQMQLGVFRDVDVDTLRIEIAQQIRRSLATRGR